MASSCLCIQHGPVITAISKKSWDSRDANWGLGRKTGTPAFLLAPLIPMTQAPCRSQPPAHDPQGQKGVRRARVLEASTCELRGQLGIILPSV